MVSLLFTSCLCCFSRVSLVGPLEWVLRIVAGVIGAKKTWRREDARTAICMYFTRMLAHFSTWALSLIYMRLCLHDCAWLCMITRITVFVSFALFSFYFLLVFSSFRLRSVSVSSSALLRSFAPSLLSLTLKDPITASGGSGAVAPARCTCPCVPHSTQLLPQQPFAPCLLCRSTMHRAPVCLPNIRAHFYGQPTFGLTPQPAIQLRSITNY